MSGKCQEFVWWSKQTYTQVLKLYISCVHFKEVLCNNGVSNSICVIVLLTVYLYLALLRSLIYDSDVFAYFWHAPEYYPEHSHCPQAWIQIQHVCTCNILKRDDDRCMLTRSLCFILALTCRACRGHKFKSRWSAVIFFGTLFAIVCFVITTVMVSSSFYLFLFMAVRAMSH